MVLREYRHQANAIFITEHIKQHTSMLVCHFKDLDMEGSITNKSKIPR